MEGKRIVFTTATPNDQGGVIPNNSLWFERFKKNPVVLCQHDWGKPPIGLMTDVKFDAAKGEWSGVPVFHRITKESQEYADMYDGGWIRACSIGGEAEWKTNGAGQIQYDPQGNKVCEKFVLYEISIVTLPSNHDAVQVDALNAKVYTKEELAAIDNAIVNLSSQYTNFQGMEPKKDPTKSPEQLRLEAAQKELDEAKAAQENAEKERQRLQAGGAPTTDPSISQNPGVIQAILASYEKIFDRFMSLFGHKPGEKVANAAAPAQQDQPESKVENPTYPQPTPTGLSAEQAAAKAKADETSLAAEAALKAAEEAKAKAEKEGASQADMDDYSAKYAAAEKACQEAEAAASAFKSCMEKKVEPTTNAAGGTGTQAVAGKPPVVPKLKTPEELAAMKLNLAPKPEIKARLAAHQGVSYSMLTAKGNEEGNRIYQRVMAGNGGGCSVSDVGIVLNSFMQDDRTRVFAEKLRVINTTMSALESRFRRQTHIDDLHSRPGMTLQQLAAKIARGSMEVLGRDGVMREMTMLDSTDDALANPSLYTIQWLDLAIFSLFPRTDWKGDIPMFGAQMTSANRGLIIANVAADPEIFFGDKPNNPAVYEADDDAVALTLFQSWLQPMRWTPMNLHQLRYDKMAVQWAQAFAKWGSLIDDKLLYTLGAVAPADSYIFTRGQSDTDGIKSFTLTGADDPDSFYYNPTLQGTFAAPGWSDFIRMEQILSKQNFNLDAEKIVCITDPTMDRYIDDDPRTKSLLTRFTQTTPEDVMKIKHVTLKGRQRICAYDTASQQIKDPGGVLPATTISAGLYFIPNQIGQGLGMLDVFMIQDPVNYGYLMSADIRNGIVPVRKNYNGLGAYTYGAPVNP